MLNSKYIEELVQRSRKELMKEIQVENIAFDKFELINSFLIFKTLNQGDFSLSINIPNRDDKRDFYLPTLISVAATLFVQNYVDDKTCYRIGDIVQKDGKRYKIVDIKDDSFTIVGDDPGRTNLFPSKKSIRKYILTTADLSKRKVKTKFDNYRNLFKLLFEEEYVPSKFSYKSAIIVERKDFLESLLDEKIPNIELKKAIPFKWVTKKGIEKNESEFIPIEPMIYLLPDYETFKEFVLEDIDKLDSVVFIGRNKYIPHITKIRKDIRNGTIPKAIFIGSADIEHFQNLKKWKWTHSEVNYFDTDKEISGQTSFKIIAPEHFLQSISKFEERINEIEEEYCFNLNSIHRLKKYFHSLVMPNQQSRLSSQIEYIRHVYKKEIQSVLFESFLDINKDPTPYIEELSAQMNEILDLLAFDKYETLKDSEEANILIVPERFLETWEEESKNELVKSFRKSFKITSFSDFKKKHNDYKSDRHVYFLTLFGFNDLPLDIFRFIAQSSMNYHFILYPEEKLFADSLIAKVDNELIREFRSEDRYHFCGIEFPFAEKEETVSELMNRLYGQDQFDVQREYAIGNEEHVDYELSFANSETIVLEGSKRILLEKDGFKRKETVSNLILGDKIRVYENTAKEKLFDIAVESDDKGIFERIINASKLWKQCLLNYFNLKRSLTFSENELLSEIQLNGGRIQSAALKKWLDIEDKVLFPSEILNLVAVKETISCQTLNDGFEEIKQMRKLYRGIMIALGRDMSDEIMDYIVSGRKIVGKILSQFSSSQIESIIDANAPLHTIEAIRIIESSDNE